MPRASNLPTTTATGSADTRYQRGVICFFPLSLLSADDRLLPGAQGGVARASGRANCMTLMDCACAVLRFIASISENVTTVFQSLQLAYTPLYFHVPTTLFGFRVSHTDSNDHGVFVALSDLHHGLAC